MTDQVLDIETTLRSSDLGSLVDVLRKQSAAKYDVVAQASRIRIRDGVLVLVDDDVVIDDDGVTATDSRFVCSDIFDSGMSEKLGIPRQYVRKMRETAVRGSVRHFMQNAAGDIAEGSVDFSLLDANVNAWLDTEPGRKFLVRTFKESGKLGVARALLSDSYAPIDNLDVLTAALTGIKNAGVEIEITGATLTERRMSLRVVAPEIAVLAPILLANYRSPFGGGIERVREIADREGGLGYAPGGEPIVFAGFEIANSEIGGGAYSITPLIEIEICRNGMKIKEDVLRSVHLGSKLEEGVIRWSGDTMKKSLDLVSARTTDAVSTFLDIEYVKSVIERVERKAGSPVRDAQGTIEQVSKKFGFSDAEQSVIFDCFIKSGSLTAGGVMNAVTAAAQTIVDPDRASELEDVAIDVLDAAARMV